MNFFFDTSVLVAVFLESHERHAASLAEFVRAEPQSAFCSAHSLAEFYSTVTRLPGNSRLAPAQALLFLESIREHLTIVALTTAETLAALKLAAAADIAGGNLYDFLHAQCALKSEAKTILTWNTKHFTQLGPEIANRVRTP